MSDPKILFLDIETAPNLATVWSLWEQNIGTSQLIDASYVLCWAAKWKGEGKLIFDSVHDRLPKGWDKMPEKEQKREEKKARKKVVVSAWNILNQADIIVHYNGRRFDMPTLNREFLIFKKTPPSPYKQIDLYLETKKHFMFVSNKMDYIAERLGIPKKKPTTHQLWLDCMNNKASAWKIMKAYNMHDVEITEKIYGKMLGWIQEHPNMGLWTEDRIGLVCPKCGSHRLHSHGWERTKVKAYRRFKCKDCGTWCRKRKADKAKSPDTLVGISAT